MNGKDLFEGLGTIDEYFIYEAEVKSLHPRKKIIKFGTAMVASFAIIILSASLLKAYYSPPISEEIIITPNDSAKDTLQFNKDNFSFSENNIYIEGHFWNELSVEQSRMLFPVFTEKKYKITGTMNYSFINEISALWNVQASVTISDNQKVKVTLAPDKVTNCYILNGTPLLSEINGITITAGVFKTDKNSKGERNYIYFADFQINDVFYYVEYASFNQTNEEFFTEIIKDIISNDSVDLSLLNASTIPEIIDTDLSIQGAYADEIFGDFLLNIPNDYEFNSAYRLSNQSVNYLYSSWSKNTNDVTMKISILNENSISRLVSPTDIELYDMSLYSIPWSESMPMDKRETITNPVFNVEDLTLDLIKMRTYTRNESDTQENVVTMRFSVLFGDVVIEIYAEGLSPEYIFEELSLLKGE